jgi:hypothetical protein
MAAAGRIALKKFLDFISVNKVYSFQGQVSIDFKIHFGIYSSTKGCLSRADNRSILTEELFHPSGYTLAGIRASEYGAAQHAVFGIPGDKGPGGAKLDYWQCRCLLIQRLKRNPHTRADHPPIYLFSLSIASIVVAVPESMAIRGFP